MQGYFCRETANAGGQQRLRDCYCKFANTDASGGPIFSLAREKMGEKRVREATGCILRLNLGKSQCFGLAFHSMVTLHISYYAPPDTGVSGLQLVALERLLSIEDAVEIQVDVTFLRGRL